MPSSFLLTSVVGIVVFAIGHIALDGSSGNEIDRPALLREAHNLASQLPVEQRAGVLSRVAHGAGILRMPEAKSWSQELFELAGNLKPEEREGVQQSAASAMSKADPDVGLAMLLAVEPAPPPDFMGHVFAHLRHNVPEPQTTSVVFSAYFEHYGVAGLPELEGAAQKLATHGDYPFTAWSKIIQKLQSTDSRQSQDLMKQILTAAASAPYPPNPTNDNLMQFLEESSQALPASTKRELAQIAVKRILDSSEKDSEDSHGAYAIAIGPNSANFTNSTDATLYRYLATIRTADPELAESLLKSRPELAAAPQPEAESCCVGFTSAGVSFTSSTSRVASGSGSGFVGSGGGSGFGTSSASSALREPPRLPLQFTRQRDVMNIVKESSSDPKAAIAAADALSDDGARAKAFAQLASSQHCCDSSTAAELLTKASTLCTKQDPETQMDCLLDISSASLMRNDTETYEAAIANFLQLASHAQKQGRNLSFLSRFSWGVLARGMDLYPQRTLAAIRATTSACGRSTWPTQVLPELGGDGSPARSLWICNKEALCRAASESIPTHYPTLRQWREDRTRALALLSVSLRAVSRAARA